MFAFSLPQNGTINSLAAYFTLDTALTVSSPITITTQLYSSTAPNNNFVFVPSALVTFPILTPGNYPAGFVLNGTTTSLGISVTAKTRLLLVVYAIKSGNLEIPSGFFGAGLNITFLP